MREGIDIGILLQQVGVGLDQRLVVEIVERNNDGNVLSLRHVSVRRAAIIDPSDLVRIIIEQSDIDDAPRVQDRRLLKERE